MSSIPTVDKTLIGQLVKHVLVEVLTLETPGICFGIQKNLYDTMYHSHPYQDGYAYGPSNLDTSSFDELRNYGFSHAVVYESTAGEFVSYEGVPEDGEVTEKNMDRSFHSNSERKKDINKCIKSCSF